MDAVGVDGAVLVSPFSMYRFDVSYVLEVEAKYPDRHCQLSGSRAPFRPRSA
jgi:hypothetical protein